MQHSSAKSALGLEGIRSLTSDSEKVCFEGRSANFSVASFSTVLKIEVNVQSQTEGFDEEPLHEVGSS